MYLRHFPIQHRERDLKGLERKLRHRQLSHLLGFEGLAELEFTRFELWGPWGYGASPHLVPPHLFASHGFKHLL